MQFITLDNAQQKLLAGFAIFAISTGAFLFWRGHSESVDAAALNQLVEVPSGTSTDSPIQSEVIVVNVAGKVLHPGVYRLSAGARVIDAIEMAGGKLAGVDISNINLARTLTDGEQILVGKNFNTSVRKKISVDNPLDINTATIAQFDQLPGIGPVTAERIVNLRKQLGRFNSIDDLKKVTGLGGAKFLEIKPLLRI